MTDAMYDSESQTDVRIHKRLDATEPCGRNLCKTTMRTWGHDDFNDAESHEMRQEINAGFAVYTRYC